MLMHCNLKNTTKFIRMKTISFFLSKTNLLILVLFTSLYIQNANAQTAAPVKTGYVPVNGMKMYYEIHGKEITGALPLIVLHGAYMNIPSMGAIILELAKTHRVYAIEMQGHGRTNDINRPITYPNLADDVSAFMDAIGIKKADVFGYSMGAGAALQLAIRHPEKVNRLVVASVAYDAKGFQPEFTAMIPQMSVEMFPPQLEQEYRKLAVNPNGFRALATK